VPQSESNSSLFANGVASGTLAKVFTAIAKFGSQIVFARLLGPNIYGAYHLLLSITHVIDWPISGWSGATKKRLSDGTTDENEIIGSVLLVNGIFLVVISLLIYLFRDRVIAYTAVDSAPFLVLLLVLHVIVLYPVLGIVLSQERLSRAMWIETAQAILALVIQIGLLQFGFDIFGLVFGLSSATFMVTLSNVRLIPKPTRPTLATLRSLWEYAKFSSVSKLLGKGYDRFDILLIGALIGPTSVGYYEAAAVLAAPALFLSNVISSGVMPKISRLDSMNEAIKDTAEEALALSPYLAIPVFFGAIALSDVLVPTVFGESYEGGVILLPGIALYYVLKSLSSPLSEIINGLDEPRYNAKITATTLVLNIALGVPFGLRFGALGVVLATIASESARLLYLSWIASKYDIFVLSVLQGILVLCGGTMMILIHVYRELAGIASNFELSVIIIAGAVFYLGLSTTVSEELRGQLLALRM
jgi:O-antigen/teichoic acid export membrane protein